MPLKGKVERGNFDETVNFQDDIPDGVPESDTMISAVLMAGYNNEREVERYSRTVAHHYGEKYIESGYRPVRDFVTVVNGERVSKPLIQYTLEKLLENERIEEVVIVGHEQLLEQRLRNVIDSCDKTCRIVSQNTALPTDAVRAFNLIPKKVRYNSLTGNMVKGYWASKARERKDHALFVAADSPLTTNEFVNRFLEFIDRFKSEAAIIVPAVLIGDRQDGLGRLPLRLCNDTPFQFPGRTDDHGRQGFRLSSLISGNPYLFDVNTLNTAYSLRKLLSPRAQLRLFKITKKLGFPNVYSKYFMKKDLSVTEVEEIVSAFFGGRLKVVPMEGVEATYDYDGTEREYKIISGLLQDREYNETDPQG